MAIIKYACLQLKERGLKISLKRTAESKGNRNQNTLISYAISNTMPNVRYTDTPVNHWVKPLELIHVFKCKCAARGCFLQNRLYHTANSPKSSVFLKHDSIRSIFLKKKSLLCEPAMKKTWVAPHVCCQYTWFTEHGVWVPVLYIN